MYESAVPINDGEEFSSPQQDPALPETWESKLPSMESGRNPKLQRSGIPIDELTGKQKQLVDLENLKELRKEKFRLCLLRVSPQQEMIGWLHLVEDIPQIQIAKRYGLNPSTVCEHIQKVREAILAAEEEQREQLFRLRWTFLQEHRRNCEPSDSEE